MPTGLTSKIYEGEQVSGRDFLLTCARQMGALIHMRDEPLDAPITYPAVDDYYQNSLKSAQKRLADAEALDITKTQVLFDKKAAEEKASNQKHLKEKQALQKRYEQTLEEVNKWQPPTVEHENLKKEAIEQLELSIHHDCNTSYYSALSYYEKITPEEYIQHEIEYAKKDILHAEKRIQEEQERIAERIQWIDDLKASL